MSKRSSSNQEENEPTHIQDEEFKAILPQAKRSKPNESPEQQQYQQALSTNVHSLNNQLTFLPHHQRKIKSHLSAPEINLLGHEGAIYSIDFDPSGHHLCSSSMDRQIFLWDVYEENKNYNVLVGHKNAVLEVHWYTKTQILSASADKTVAIWDANRGNRIRKFTEHTAIVNTCTAARDNELMIASGSDDCTAILWDPRTKNSIATIYHDYQLCSVAFSHEGNFLFTGGIDNIIRRFDTRMIKDDTPDLTLSGHQDTITGLAISPDSNSLVSNSMDCTLRVWNIRPFATTAIPNGQPGLRTEENDAHRCERLLLGVHHGAEKLLLRCAWSKDGDYITAGSADRIVHLWETTNYGEVCGWAGHKASVNTVIIHPDEPIIASCSSDRTITLGEFTPQ